MSKRRFNGFMCEVCNNTFLCILPTPTGNKVVPCVACSVPIGEEWRLPEETGYITVVPENEGMDD